MKEIQIIKNFYKGKYPDDDCFFDGERLYTTDSLVEGTHFLHKWSTPENLARKLIEVNLSDILSSGGKPEFCFLNLGLSKFSMNSNWLQRFIKSFHKVLKTYKIQLAGGDSFYSEKTFLSLTLVSEKQTKNPVTREGARLGDFLYITGAVGFSYLGYKLLKNQKVPKTKFERLAIQKHLEPKARFDLQEVLSSFPITAMMDVTDGLVQDLEKLSLCSKLGFVVYVENLPKFQVLLQSLSINEILTSGEELELLFTSGEKISHPKIYNIGYTIKEKRVKFFLNQKEIFISNSGFEHFS